MFFKLGNLENEKEKSRGADRCLSYAKAVVHHQARNKT